MPRLEGGVLSWLMKKNDGCRTAALNNLEGIRCSRKFLRPLGVEVVAYDLPYLARARRSPAPVILQPAGYKPGCCLLVASACGLLWTAFSERLELFDFPKKSCQPGCNVLALLLGRVRSSLKEINVTAVSCATTGCLFMNFR
jgi:hypothetical protein